MGRRKKGQKIDGWVNLYKPVGVTSTQAVGKVRRIFDAQKAGHAGTLDPLAEGILPIALGEATKTIPYIQDALKGYDFEVTWGEARSTDDREGDVIESSDVRPSAEDIQNALPGFIGEIEQTPPKFSAIKIDGERAYDLARDGEEFEIKSRQVYIEGLELLPCHSDRPQGVEESEKGSDPSTALGMTCGGLGMTLSRFSMICGKGTYVRSLARDLAQKLGTCGYVSGLKRTHVGCFSQEDAIFLEKLEEMDHNTAMNSALLPLQTALDDIPAISLKAEETARLKNGNDVAFIARPDFQRLHDAGINDNDTALALFQDAPVALVERQGPHIKPVRVFNL